MFCKGCGFALNAASAPAAPASVAQAPAAPAPAAPAPVAPDPVAPDPVATAPVAPVPVAPAPVAPVPVAPVPVAPAPVAAPATGPRLVVVSNVDSGTEFAIAKSPTALGREPSMNDIAFPKDGYVSSVHALITQEGADIYIEDRGSTNGTYKQLKGKTKLEPGDVIKVGDTNLEFRV